MSDQDARSRTSPTRHGTGTGSQLSDLTDYELSHLIAHLELAGRPQRAHQVLALSTPQGRNAWYEERSARGGASGYREDLRRARRLSNEAFQDAGSLAERADALGLQVRYALALSSLGHRARSIPPDLVVAAVREGVWSSRRAIDYMQADQFDSGRWQVARAILPLLPWDTARGLAHSELSARGLDALLELLDALPRPIPIEWSQEISSILSGVSDVFERTRCLSALAVETEGSLGAHIAEDVARDILAITDPGDRLKAFEACAENLSTTARATAASLAEDIVDASGPRIWSAPSAAKAVVAMLEGPSDGLRVRLLRDLFSLSSPSVDLVAALAPVLHDGEFRRLVASMDLSGVDSEALLRQLSPETAALLPPKALDAAVRRASKERGKLRRISSLMELAEHCPARAGETLRMDALELARSLQIHQGRPSALALVACGLRGSRRTEIVNDTLEALAKHPEGPPLAKLAQHLEPRQVPAALCVARSIESPSERFDALFSLQGVVRGSLRSGLVASQLAAARQQGGSDQVDSLAQLIPSLRRATRRGVVEEAFAVALGLTGWSQSNALAALAPYLPGEYVQMALEQVRRIGDDDTQAFTMTLMTHYSGHAPSEILTRRALTLASARLWRLHQAQPLLGLIPSLVREEQIALAIDAATTPPPQYRRSRDHSNDVAITGLTEASAPRLSPTLRRRLLDLLHDVQDADLLKSALNSMAPFLTQDELSLAASVAEAAQRPDVLASLATYTDSATRGQLVERAFAQMAKHQPRIQALTMAHALACLPPSSTPAMLRELASLIPSTELRGFTHPTLSAIPDHVIVQAPDLLVEACDRIRHADERARCLVSLASRLPDAMGAQAARTAKHRISEIRDPGLRLRFLADLAAVSSGQAKRDLEAQALAAVISDDLIWSSSSIRAVRGFLKSFPADVSSSLLTRITELGESGHPLRLLDGLDARIEIAAIWPNDVASRAVTQALQKELSTRRTGAEPDLDCLAALPQPLLEEAWSAALDELSRTSRRGDSILNLSSLLPAIERIGGQRLAESIAAEVDLVTSWWE